MTENTGAIPQPPATPPPATPPPAQQVPADTVRKLAYSHARRAGYGILWAAWTALLAISGFAALFGGQILVGLLILALGGLAGHYDYRIWTWRARRLLFLIIW